jgi:hypothetical protein
MLEPPAPWHPLAAYLYTLRLDCPGLAWEYLRRHPDYLRDWQTHQRGADADPRPWGLHRFEDPTVDARDAQPDWLPDPPGSIQIHSSLDPSPGAGGFRLWRLPGHKRLGHDGHRLRLVAQLAACVLRIVLTPSIEDGMAVAYTFPATEDHMWNWQGVEQTVAFLDFAGTYTQMRPGQANLIHMRSLQALDGVQAGASMKQIATALFGARETDARWHSESELRAQVRYLVRRGRHLMHGGYRRLLHPRRLGKGERDHPADSP